MTDARIEAATRAIQAAWITAAHPMMRDGLNTQEYAEQAFRLAQVALAAADAVEESSAVATRTALRHLAAWHEPHDIICAECDSAMALARVLVSDAPTPAKEDA